MTTYRKERLEELIKRIVADSILKEIRDPRIGFVTVTGVELNKDKSIANVHVSVLGDGKVSRNTMSGLLSAAGFIQRRVGDGIKMRSTPQIRFHLDKSLEYGSDMINLLNNLEEERSRKEKDNPENPDGDEV